jgi:hypothetical protein
MGIVVRMGPTQPLAYRAIAQHDGTAGGTSEVIEIPIVTFEEEVMNIAKLNLEFVTFAKWT